MIDFSELQKKTIAGGITLLALALIFLFTGAVAWVILKGVGFVSGALVPVVLGFLLSLFFRPYYRWLKKYVKKDSYALGILLLSVLIPAGLLAWYTGAIAVDQISNLIDQAPALTNRVLAWFQETFPKFKEILDRFGVPYKDVGSLYTDYSGSAIAAGAGAIKFLKGIVSALVTLLFFVFFLTSRQRKGSEIVNEMPILKTETRNFLAEQIDAFIEILVSFFQRQVIICLIEGVMYGVGFAAVGLPYGFIIGFALGVINLIPFCGSLVCLPVAIPLAYFGPDGSGLRLGLVIAVWATGQILDGYLITPRIQGNRTGLGYAGVIFSFFFWSKVLGPVLGMLLAIPLSAFCLVLWRAIKKRYLKPVV